MKKLLIAGINKLLSRTGWALVPWHDLQVAQAHFEKCCDDLAKTVRGTAIERLLDERDGREGWLGKPH
jgi:hypothetical protein